ncbi:hypothetical protein ACTXT7_007620 [Hymenolepis weldensis]
MFAFAKESHLSAGYQTASHATSLKSFDGNNKLKNGEISCSQTLISPLEKLDLGKWYSFSNINSYRHPFNPYISPPKYEGILIPLDKKPDSISNYLQLPSGLLYSPLIVPSFELPFKYECVNDIQNRRRKMKKHKRRKWRKKYASLIRRLRMQREKREEKKLQELLDLWRSRSEAWDPAIKIERRLMFARRSGYYDIKPMEPEGSNPVSETRKGQLAIVEVANVVRDLTLALNRVYENVRDTQGTKHLNAELPKNFKERVDTFQERRNTIKKAFESVSQFCSQLAIDDPEDIIPYVDDNDRTIELQQDSEKVIQLKTERVDLLKQIAELDSQLLSYKDTLTSALWELNDLMHSTGS